MEAAAKREGLADEASLRSLLAPGSIAVLGDVAHPATRRLMDELAPFSGPVHYGGVEGADLPDDARPELAVVTSPPERAVAAVRRCAERGVRAIIVTATGFDREQGLDLLKACRANGMRLVGPGSLGVAAPHGADGFSALLSATAPDPGPAGVAVQSGGVGLALLSHLDRLGIGVSTFAAVGEKYDVSANDLLLHWEQDSDTKLGLLHVESFGNPRKFAHTARRLSRLIPLLAVDPEQSLSQARTALYAQAGIIAVPSLGALVDAAALAAHQPLPRGRRVAVIGNTHGMVSLAVQACLYAGFEVTHAVDATPSADAAKLAEHITHAFERTVPAADSTEADDAAAPTAPESIFLALAPATPELTDLDPAMEAVPAGVTVLAVLVGQPESVAVRRCGPHQQYVLPCYNDAAAAADALTAARRAGRVRQLSPTRIEYPPNIDLPVLRAVVESGLDKDGAGRELSAAENAELLAALGVGDGRHPRVGLDAREATITAWQDKVFGPVLFGLSDLWRQPVTMLAPLDAGTAESVAARVAGDPAPALADLFRRVAALVDACPEIASFRLDVEFDESGVRRGEGVTLVAPAETQNPYLRRLRRAPVE
ncbi:MAG TPA: CoA-binding protein, partial [Dactylosporangium sp.]|jgi:hypothetical protein|nr:CoA-binding protein [Dactylosporangium sp.]